MRMLSMYERILVRYGELTLKGKNKHLFVAKVVELIKSKLTGLNVTIDKRHDRLYIELNQELEVEVIKRLNRVSGLHSYSLITKCNVDIDEIATIAIEMIKPKIKEDIVTFKVETKRADKSYPLTSQQLSPKIASKILRTIPNLKVDVHNPSLTLFVEVREDGAYIYIDQIKGMGGYPVGIGGKALLLLSGGIDSPVAGYLAMKQGIEIECVHFESTPMTSIESVQKTIDLVEKLSIFAPHNKIKLHMVPFEPIHSSIMTSIPESYLVTIMRRMMYRIATDLLKKTKSLAIVNGESIGQVASQTLESMACATEVTNALIIRPLATYDKSDIMSIARTIETLDISNRPFEDCCTVYLPNNPTIRPSLKLANNFEKMFDYQPMIKQAVDKTVTIQVSAYDHTDILGKGLTVEECFE
ncbi:MAG: tRNA 4-thiouridine(8) synthase ThiI [Tenericutes bacterium HGW-Tenericutes-1]|nr:MAG: tRNA 4-thiouridine(8) synthase ThiI [Tenericutes bacterium HGW-Tenericutes-1]